MCAGCRKGEAQEEGPGKENCMILTSFSSDAEVLSFSLCLLTLVMKRKVSSIFTKQIELRLVLSEVHSEVLGCSVVIPFVFLLKLVGTLMERVLG